MPARPSLDAAALPPTAAPRRGPSRAPGLATTATAATLVLADCAAPSGGGPAPVPAEAPPVRVYAAGSLRDVLTELAREHQARTGQVIALQFGPSGLMRERIERGEPAQILASADTRQPQRLADAGGWEAPRVFVRNALCALAQEDVALSTDTLLARLLEPGVRLGTSTPGADPAGDYAWTLFRHAERVRPGAYATLERKALQLTGGPASPAPPPGRNAYAWVMGQRQADVFLTYCTNAVAARAELPRLQIVAVPAPLQVSAAYGLTVRQGAPAAARAFADALLAPPAQAVFARYGFAAP